ncbi:MAG: YeeE/YedE family protein [Acidocella sp.]|nr:YeeE/YedE family protein [Acidocella sp.]
MVARQAGLGLFAGALFGAGLAMSGMADPARVRGFLDIFGAWDETLAFVMGGAIIPMAMAWRVQRRMRRPMLAASFTLPDTRDIDWRLGAGAVIFGLGWGIAGLCPGPAIADLAINPRPAALFVASMAGGMVLFRLINRP